MKCTLYTPQISIGLLVITALYTLAYSGLTGLLLAASVALITAAFVDSMEVIVALTVLFAVLYTVFLKRYMRSWEPFANPSSEEIIHRIQEIQGGSEKKNKGPVGVYGEFSEGFADVNDSKGPKEEKEGESITAPASTSEVKSQVSAPLVKEVTDAMAKMDMDNAKDREKEKKIEKEEFQSATGQLFKLGQMPSEHADGPVLDPGQTLMKAMNSLDPNTVSAMTMDTKKLLETQKGLMAMLNQMRPVLADGKELLSTFAGMFGGK